MWSCLSVYSMYKLSAIGSLSSGSVVVIWKVFKFLGTSCEVDLRWIRMKNNFYDKLKLVGGNCLMLSSNQWLRKPMLTKMYIAIWCKIYICFLLYFAANTHLHSLMNVITWGYLSCRLVFKSLISSPQHLSSDLIIDILGYMVNRVHHT